MGECARVCVGIHCIPYLDNPSKSLFFGSNSPYSSSLVVSSSSQIRSVVSAGLIGEKCAFPSPGLRARLVICIAVIAGLRKLCKSNVAYYLPLADNDGEGKRF